MWTKKLRVRKIQSIVIVTIALISTLLISSALGILITLDKPINKLSMECNSPILKIYQGQNASNVIGNLDDVDENLNNLNCVSKTIKGKRHYVNEQIICNDKKIDNFVNLVEYDNSVYEDHIRFSDNKVSELQDDECIIPNMFANVNNINIGDEIKIKGNGFDKEYKVVSKYADPYSLNSAFTMNIFISKIPDNVQKDDVILVYGKENISGQEILDSYREKNNGYLDGYPVTLEECIENSTIAENITGGILFGVGILILLVSVVMFSFMIKSALINDKKTIAIYKAIGYSYRDILLINIKFYSFLILSGSIVGAVLSNIIVNNFLADSFKNIGETNNYSNVLPALICTITIVLFILMSIYMILKKMKKITPVEAFRDDTINSKNKIKRSKFSYSFSPFGMALRNIFRDRKNSFFVLLICIISIYIINFGIQSLSKVKSMKDDNYYWFGFDKCDVIFETASLEKFDDMYKEIVDDKDTEVTYKTSTKTINLAWQKGMTTTSVDVKLYEDYENLSLNVLEGHNPASTKEIAISSKISDDLGKSIGDYIDIYMNQTEKVSFLICGIYQTYCELGRQIRMTSDTFEKYNEKEPLFNEASIYLKDGVDKEKYIDRLNDKFNGQGKVIQRKEKFENVMEKICKPQEGSISPFIFVTLILAGINIFGIVILRNSKNRKSTCIYKSIGFSSFELLMSNIIYVLIIAIASIIITVPLFFLTYTKLMSICLMSFGIREYPIDFNLLSFILSNSSVVLLFILFTLLSSRQIYKYKVTELNVE